MGLIEDNTSDSQAEFLKSAAKIVKNTLQIDTKISTLKIKTRDAKKQIKLRNSKNVQIDWELSVSNAEIERKKIKAEKLNYNIRLKIGKRARKIKELKIKYRD